MNSGLLQLPHVLSSAPFTFTSKGLALAISSFIFFAWIEKLREKGRGSIFSSSFSYFWPRVRE